MNFRPAAPALAAALLFGASTPLAKWLVGEVRPLLLAGLLYLGSGLGLAVLLLLRRAKQRAAGRPAPAWSIPRREWPWLAGAIVFGGVLGPALLMVGLAQSTAASVSLLLNVEGVFTALIAWLVFRENADRRVVAGMAAIVAGGVLLAWRPGGASVSHGALLVVAACGCWAIDNNLTRRVSTHDAMLVAGLKGLAAGACNTALAFAYGGASSHLPPMPSVAASLLLGFVGYGLSLTLFVVALRTLGAARTGAYFSVAPLFGVIVSLAIWPALPGPLFWVAAGLMAMGVWLHVRERHEHVHSHAPLLHDHAHDHGRDDDDGHHRHAHAFAWDGATPHAHPHAHEALVHRHPHYPDIHHRHPHGHPHAHKH